MGYRQYFYGVDKLIIDGFRQCKTEEELYNFCISNGIECYKDENDCEIHYYCPLYKLGKEVFGFGKYYENSDKLYEHGDSLFMSQELNERYSDYGAIICDKEAIKCAIEWQIERITQIYEDLLKEKSGDDWNEESQFDRLKEHVNDYLIWWKNNRVFDLNDDADRLTNSWIYEHTIFDLVRLYKTFDFERRTLLFCGW